LSRLKIQVSREIFDRSRLEKLFQNSLRARARDPFRENNRAADGRRWFIATWGFQSGKDKLHSSNLNVIAEEEKRNEGDFVLIYQSERRAIDASYRLIALARQGVHANAIGIKFRTIG